MHKPESPILAAVGIATRHDSRSEELSVLLTRRDFTGVSGGLWHCPGGKPKAREALHIALIREFQEEVGVRVRIDGPLPVAICEMIFPLPEFRHAVANHYRVSIIGGEPRALEGTASVAWFTREGVAKLEADEMLLNSTGMALEWALGWSRTPPRHGGPRNPHLGLTPEEWLRMRERGQITEEGILIG